MSCAVAGDPQACDEFVASCQAAGIRARRIPGIDTAGHSTQVDALREQLVSELAVVAPRACPRFRSTPRSRVVCSTPLVWTRTTGTGTCGSRCCSVRRPRRCWPMGMTCSLRSVRIRCWWARCRRVSISISGRRVWWGRCGVNGGITGRCWPLWPRRSRTVLSPTGPASCPRPAYPTSTCPPTHSNTTTTGFRYPKPCPATCPRWASIAVPIRSWALCSPSPMTRGSCSPASCPRSGLPGSPITQPWTHPCFPVPGSWSWLSTPGIRSDVT